MSLGHPSNRPPRRPRRQAAAPDLKKLFNLAEIESSPDARDARASPATRVFATLASACLGAVLPMLMVVANKSAPATLGAAALFATVAALLGPGAEALKARYRLILGAPEARVVLGVVCLAALSLAWSVDRAMTMRGLVEDLPELLFALALAAAWPLVAELRHVHWLLLGLIGAAVLIAFERLAGMPLHALVHARGEAYDLKRSAIPPALLVWPAIGFCLQRGQVWASLGLFVSAIVGIVAAHSGAPGFALAAAAAFFLAARWSPRIATGVSAVAVALLVVASAWTGTLATRLLPPSFENALSEEHAANRIEIWTAFEKRLGDRPLLGHGFDASFKVAAAPRPLGRPAEDDNGVLVDNHPHNIFLQFWVEFGLLGAMAAAAVSAFVVRRVAALPPRVLPTRLGLLVTVIGVGLVGLSAWQPWWLASIAAALIWFDLLRERTGG